MPKPHADARGAPEDTSFSDASERVSDNVRHYRAIAGLSQEELAELCGCDPRHIQRIESPNVAVNAQLRLLASLARSLDVDIAALFAKPRGARRGSMRRANKRKTRSRKGSTST